MDWIKGINCRNGLNSMPGLLPGCSWQASSLPDENGTSSALLSNKEAFRLSSCALRVMESESSILQAVIPVLKSTFLNVIHILSFISNTGSSGPARTQGKDAEHYILKCY